MTHHPPNPDDAAAPSTGPGQALRKQAETAFATRTRELEAVQAVAAEITQELDLDRLLGLILQRAAELVGVQAGSIHLWEDTTQRLVGRVWRGQGAWVDAPPLPLGAGVVGTVAAQKSGLLVNDYQASAYALPHLRDQQDFTAVLAEPFLYQDRLLGVININNEGTAKTFTLTDQALLRLFATQAAIAIENARLFTEATQSLHELQQEVARRQQAEDDLRTSRALLHAVVEGTTDTIFVKDLQGRYLLFNTAAEQFTGKRAADTLGHDARLLFPPAEAAAIMLRDRAVLAGGKTVTTEDELSDAAGAPHTFLSTRGPLLDAAGQPIGLFGIARDITERKRAETEKATLEAQTQHLQKAESLGRMAGGIAHHFNNQLQAVLGNLELALGALPRAAEGPGAFLTEALQATRRAAELSGLMLTYLGQTPSTREPLDLSRVCRLCLPLLRAVLPKTVVLESDLPSPGPAVRANANQMHQVVTNLLTNAWEAGRSAPCVIHASVTTAALAEIPTAHRFPVDWQPQHPAYACLEVADTGCGIAAKDIDSLFDPFFSSKFPGRGMGLPVVLGIVRAHQGAITVESTPGRGSRFRVYLPLTADPLPRSPEQAVHAPDRHGGTVLVVDDEAMVRRLAVAMLTDLGFTVLTARDGVEAVDVFRQHQGDIRCVLCDLTMPRMSGWETLTALRHLAPGFPVILASGYSEEQVMDGLHPDRPQAFLGKPYRLQDLHDALRLALAEPNDGPGPGDRADQTGPQPNDPGGA